MWFNFTRTKFQTVLSILLSYTTSCHFLYSTLMALTFNNDTSTNSVSLPLYEISSKSFRFRKSSNIESSGLLQRRSDIRAANLEGRRETTPLKKMADGVDIDLYADDIEQDFAQDEFAADGVDLYDDVIAAPPGGAGVGDEGSQPPHTPGPPIPNADGHSPNSNPPYHQMGNNIQPNQVGRRHQLYVGNLTWWTTDQDITDAVLGIGVTDFVEVKFFENRANGQSKGFCVITLGSEPSMRMCMERLPKKELHGQCPVVTFPTKAALNQFEAQSKTRPVPPPNPGPRNAHPHQHPHTPRMMMGPPQGMRPRMPPPGMPPPGPGQRMPGPPISHGGPPGHGHPQGPPSQGHPPPGFQHGNWNGPRQNGPPRPGPPPQGPHPQGPQQRPPPGMQPFQGPPPGQGPPRGPPPGAMPPDPRGPPPRPEWNRPPGPGMPHHPGGPGFPPHSQPPPMQGPPPGQGPPPRGPPPGQMGGPGGPPPGHGGPSVHGGPPQGPPAPHVNPAFFQQGAGPPHQGPPHQGPPPPHGPPHGYGPPPTSQPQYGAPPPEHRPEGPPPISEAEFEEIMGRNRTVSSSAIARAVSDAAAGEYASAIETLVTAISLIKQSKVANDDRCKILISSLQDTLHGVETKSYGSARRERSRSRDRERSHRRRRERSRSRDREYRERSRERDRDRERERERDRYYTDAYPRDRSRSRERERERDYRERSREDSSARQAVRPRAKSPEPPDTAAVMSSKSRYYDDRYRERDREREREREGSRREPERERERDRERERREERESSHRSSRH